MATIDRVLLTQNQPTTQATQYNFSYITIIVSLTSGNTETHHRSNTETNTLATPPPTNRTTPPHIPYIAYGSHATQPLTYPSTLQKLTQFLNNLHRVIHFPSNTTMLVTFLAKTYLTSGLYKTTLTPPATTTKNILQQEFTQYDHPSNSAHKLLPLPNNIATPHLPPTLHPFNQAYLPTSGCSLPSLPCLKLSLLPVHHTLALYSVTIHSLIPFYSLSLSPTFLPPTSLHSTTTTSRLFMVPLFKK